MKKYTPIIIILILTSCVHVRPWTTEEKIYAGASILATFADFKTQSDLMDRGGYEALNQTTGKYPSDFRLGITLGITEGVCLWLAHRFPWLRKVGLGVKTTLNTGLAIHNSQVD